MTMLERRNPAAHPWWRKVLDVLGRVGTALAVVFVVYGFIVETNRSAESKRDAAQAKVIADRVGKLGRENQRLGEDNKRLLDQIQAGRRVSLGIVCRTNNETRAAATAILKRFAIPSETGLKLIDCKALLAKASIP